MDKQLQSRFNKWRQSSECKNKIDENNELNKKLNVFTKRFSKSFIKNRMKMDDYVIGIKNNKNSFCYNVEITFRKFGEISGRLTPYQKYVIYWDKANNKYSFGDKRTKERKGFGNNEIVIFENIKTELVSLISASEENNYSAIENSPFNVQFRNKVAYLYNPKNQIPIYSNEDLNILLTLLEIPFDFNDSCETKRKKLFDFYSSIKTDNKMTPCLFMNFLYSSYGFRNALKDENITNISNGECKLIDVTFEDSSKVKKDNDKKKRCVIATQHNIEENEITGKIAEKIVIDYLKAQKDENKIQKYHVWCQGNKRNDGKGYDVSYVDNDGNEHFVEIKGTKNDLKNKISFEMSSNEYDVMNKNKDKYEIYFVNNVYNEKIIKRIKAIEIIPYMIPSKYRTTRKHK